MCWMYKKKCLPHAIRIDRCALIINGIEWFECPLNIAFLNYKEVMSNDAFILAVQIHFPIKLINATIFLLHFFSSKILPYFLHSMKNNESISQWFNALHSLFGSVKWIDSFDVTDNFQKMISCVCGRLSSTYDFQAKMIRIRLLAMQAIFMQKGVTLLYREKEKITELTYYSGNT